MDRRKALKLFGALFVCCAGYPVLTSAKENDESLKFNSSSGSMDYCFSEEGIRNIIIERKNGKKIIVPFSDIVEALET